MAQDYILGNDHSEIERLEMQAALFEPLTRQTLSSAGLRKNMRCVDIGCGSGSVSRLMSSMVGMKGSVVGLDVDEKYLKYCRRANVRSNMRFVQDDICNSQLDGQERFDIVYSRFMFQHLKDSTNAVRSMKNLAKRGGVVIIQELDHAPGSWLSYPENDVFNTLREVYVALIEKAGGDPLAGRKLYKMLTEVSLDSTMECYTPCIMMGHGPYSSLGSQLAASLKPRILAQGIQSEQEYETMFMGLKRLAKNRGAFVTYARLFSAVGRKRK